MSGRKRVRSCEPYNFAAYNTLHQPEINFSLADFIVRVLSGDIRKSTYAFEKILRKRVADKGLKRAILNISE